jgi:hypothetical protein
MLEHGIGATGMQGALVGWSGDQYVVWRAANHSWCLRDTVVMDDAGAAARFDQALSQWVATRHGRAQLETAGLHTTFKTCTG